MTLSNSQSSSGNSNSDVLVHRTSSNNRNSGSGGGSRRNNCDRGQISKNCSSQYHNKSAGELERSSSTLTSTMPIASASSYGAGDASTDQRSIADNHQKSKDLYLDDRLYKIVPEEIDPAILSRGSTSNNRRYTRSALYLLRNDTRSRCRPKCASKLQLLCIWKTNNSNYSNCNQQNGGSSLSNSSNTMDMTSSSLSSPRMSSITRQQTNNDLQSNGTATGSSHHGNQKNYLDHRSISSSHLMPAFAKRRIGNSIQSNSGSLSASPSLPISTDSLKVQGANGKSNDHKQFLSPQRKHLNIQQLSKSVPSSDGDREHDRERDRDRERVRDCERDVNLNTSGSSSSARERRIGSGRLLPRDANWDYRSEKDSNSTSTSSGSMPFEKDLSSHSSTSGNNTQRLSSNSSGNQRFDYTQRSPTSKERVSGGKNSSEYRLESRYESRRSFARGDYERDNRGDNSNYVRRFMSDLINQNSSNNFSGKSGSSGGGQNQNESRRRNHRNDEPEWFSSGPTSQHDTIELRGFDEVEDSNSNSSGSNVGNSKRNKRNALRRNKTNNSRTSSYHDLSLDQKISLKESLDLDNSGALQDIDKTSSQPASPNADSFSSLKTSPRLKSDTNNNSSRDNVCTYNDNNSCSENKTDGSVVESDFKNSSEPETTPVNINQNEDKTSFNFDAFLNADPLSNLLLGEQNSVENEAGSRFSRWFVKQGDNAKINDSRKPSLTDEMVSMLDVESQIVKHVGGIPIASESTNTNQSNTLMEFLQRGKINAASGSTEPIANVGSIPSVEELEARMRKIGDENTNSRRDQSVSNMNDNVSNPLNQFLANSVHHHQQQQKKHIQHFIIKNENQGAPLHNSGLQTQQHLHVNHSHPLAPTQTQDMEAFKKLLDQITPTALNAVRLPQPQTSIQQLPPAQQSQMHRLPPPVNMMTAIGAIPQSAPPHIMKNDELTKFIHQQQLHQRRQQHALSAQHPQMNQSAPNEMPIVQAMFLAPQQRFEAQLLLQGITRGEVTQSSLGHQLSNPNTSPRTKDVIATVLRESSRDTSPNIIMSVPQIMSPVLGQSHCAPNVPPPNPIIIPNTQQIAFNHPSQASAQQPHSSSGNNTGGLPQRIPSPRELQYHTQSIMQNALIKKKLEEQQENFRRRQEVQKQQQQMQHKPLHSPSQIEINEFGVLLGPPQQQQYPQNPQHQKKSSQQQQQIIQSQQQQQRHVNSPTPLAFTPTSVLRKMTAEKDSVTSFHTATPTPVSTTVGTGTANTSPLISTVVTQNVGTNNTNPNKPIHSLLMHYHQQQQQQQTNSSQNQPRMILGVGSQQQQQQQQQGVAIITGPSIQQQHPDSARLNPNLLRNNQLKWSGPIMNQISIAKPMGRPILKGSLSQSIPPPTNSGLNPIHQQQSQPLAPQMAFASKIEFQQIQQQRSNSNQTQPPPHPQKQQQSQQQPMPSQQQAQNIVMTQLYQQRAALQRAQQYQLHHLHQHQQQMNIIQSNGSRSADRIGSNANTNQSVSSCGNIINYQRDGGLSPTSNQLARWFSPELLAQASAGKLPPLNMNQALSLEEFEKSIQHSSTAVNN